MHVKLRAWHGSAQHTLAVLTSALQGGRYYYPHFPSDLFKHHYLNQEFLLQGAPFLHEGNYGGPKVGPEPMPGQPFCLLGVKALGNELFIVKLNHQDPLDWAAWADSDTQLGSRCAPPTLPPPLPLLGAGTG